MNQYLAEAIDMVAAKNMAELVGKSARCVSCGRALSDAGSLLRGMGPVCFGKAAKSDSGALLGDQPVLNDVGTLEEVGLVCRLLENGSLACNVPQVVVHHSPTGFGCGFGGSGAADLALNVLHQLLPPKHDHMDRIYGDVVVSNDAARLHQEMKWRFIATMPAAGGRVPIEDMMQWIYAKLIEGVL